ncbi:Ca(2+)-dependent cysteine protease [Lecanora helva]
MSFFPGQGQQHGYPPQQPYYGGPPPQNYGPPPQGYGGPPPQGYPPQNGYPPQGYPPQGYPPQQGYGPPHHQPPRPMSQGYQQQPPTAGYGYGPPPPGGPQYQGRPGLPSVSSNAYVQGNHHAPPPPPSGQQGFGSGAPQGYNFQYSNCTGRRKALLIGINYFGQKGQLRGCINDVKNMSGYLNGNFGYAREDMVILTDDQQNPMSQPTKQNMLRAMHWLVKDAKPNDSLFFHYSGHGGQTPDLDGDEEDGYDEVVYPVDFRSAGHIVDDEMHRIMVQSLQPGVRLTAIFDSCHSGSALDLPYIYSTSGVLKEPNLAKEAGQGLLGIVSAYARGDMGSMASTAMGFFKKATKGDDTYERNKVTKTSPADVVMWSGSKDDQTSQDAQIAGQATGAMSWAFISALKKNPQQSYVSLLNSIRDELESRYTQKPQLSCSHPLSKQIPVTASTAASTAAAIVEMRDVESHDIADKDEDMGEGEKTDEEEEEDDEDKSLQLRSKCVYRADEIPLCRYEPVVRYVKEDEKEKEALGGHDGMGSRDWAGTYYYLETPE